MVHDFHDSAEAQCLFFFLLDAARKNQSSRKRKSVRVSAYWLPMILQECGQQLLGCKCGVYKEREEGGEN
jgi:hypothetical protein